MKISVLLPIYNAEKFLEESINSILNQTYSDFELIAIDDGSTDSSIKVLSSFTDKRIKIILNESNIGLVNTLNKGIDMCEGEYIARMDADDISFSTRFEKQVKLLDSNTDIGVCSTWLEFFGDTHEIIKFPVDHNEIFWRFLLGVQLGHANSMIRRNLLEKFNIRYNALFPHSEDTNLWVNLLPHTKFANVPEVLYKYRKYNEQVTQVYAETVMDSFNRSVNLHFRNILKLVSISKYEMFDLYPTIGVDVNSLNEFEDISIELIQLNNQQKRFCEGTVKAVLLQLWKNKISNCALSSSAIFQRIFTSRFPAYVGFPLVKRIKFFIKLA